MGCAEVIDVNKCLALNSRLNVPSDGGNYNTQFAGNFATALRFRLSSKSSWRGTVVALFTGPVAKAIGEVVGKKPSAPEQNRNLPRAPLRRGRFGHVKGIPSPAHDWWR